jgi:hypothetical protein
VNDRITLGAAVWVAGILAVRWALSPVREPGRHRSPRVHAVADAAALAEWEPVYGTALEQTRGERT